MENQIDSQIAIKPSYNVSVGRKKTNIKHSEQVDQEFTYCKFPNSTDISNIFNSNKYIDYVIPSNFHNLSKISQAVIDLECQLTCNLDAATYPNQLIYMNYDTLVPDRLTTTLPPVTNITHSFTVSGVVADISTILILDSNIINNGSTLNGTYTIEKIQARSVTGTVSITGKLGTFLKSTNALDTTFGTTTTINMTNTYALYSFPPVVIPPTVNINLATHNFGIYFEFSNIVGVSNVVDVNFQTNTSNSPTLTRNSVAVPDVRYVQNLPIWAMLDRYQILINGKIADECSSANYFCELALACKEELRQYSSTMMFDKDNYGLLYKYPGVIIFSNPDLTPTTVSKSVKFQLPLFSTFLTSENYLCDFVKDQITVRVFFRPYDNFKLSSLVNQANKMTLLGSSMYLGGVKFDPIKLNAIKQNREGKDIVSMILLRKYGSDKLVRLDSRGSVPYAPLFGQSVYDLSFLTGRFLCLFTLLYPDDVVGGENYLQYGLVPKSTATSSAYDSEPITYSASPYVYPPQLGVQQSKNNQNGFEYLYTPDSAFRLDRCALIDDNGNPIYQNLQYSDFLRNIMSTVGINSDFLKTYAIYPMYFTNDVGTDFKSQHASSGFLNIENIYNLEIILSNPESSTLPFYASNVLVNSLQNSLYTVGLQIAELHIKSDGKIKIISH
jgi:hypothetical protein